MTLALFACFITPLNAVIPVGELLSSLTDAHVCACEGELLLNDTAQFHSLMHKIFLKYVPDMCKQLQTRSCIRRQGHA